MKRKLIAMLMIGVMAFSMVACGDKDEETSTDSSTDTVVEENENDETEAEDEEALEDEETNINVKKIVMTEDEKFEHNKKVSKELLEYLKKNNIKSRIIENNDSEFWIEFDQKVNDVEVNGEYRYEKGVVLQATIYVFFDKSKAKLGNVNIDLNKTIVPKIHEIVTGTSGKSYEKYKEGLNEVANNMFKDKPSEDIPTIFNKHIDGEKFGELIEIKDGSDNIDIIIGSNK